MAQTPTNTARSFLAWVFAGLLIAGGAAFLVVTSGLVSYAGPLALLASAASVLLAVPFLIRWLVHRQDSWALISAWVFFAIGALVAVFWLAPDPPQVPGAALLLAVGLPFLVAFAAKPARWWPLIPGYSAAALAALLGLTYFRLTPEVLAAFALLLVALPFWGLYMADRLKWWAMVVAGVFSLLGVGMLAFFSLVSLFRSGSQAFYVIVNAGLGLAFLGLWLAVRRFEWALWAAIGFFASAVASVFLPSSAAWALLALTMGLYIASQQIRRGRRAAPAAQASQQPAVQPQTSAAPAQPAAPAPATPPAAQSQRSVPVNPANEEAPPGGHPDQRPVVQFRPLDPLAIKKKQEDDKEDEDQS